MKISTNELMQTNLSKALIETIKNEFPDHRASEYIEAVSYTHLRAHET